MQPNKHKSEDAESPKKPKVEVTTAEKRFNYVMWCINIVVFTIIGVLLYYLLPLFLYPSFQ